eukprot:TRINITY_DN5174_c0_g1_i3.p1 TRINITY_DN5174_c0_g1~~TRINITY_DN5174_c0_g1_i3.p1  ORF type:complete len:315 (-),score=50.34 TRINITY_DN5174_c0_g1_i3:31-975(-)
MALKDSTVSLHDSGALSTLTTSTGSYAEEDYAFEDASDMLSDGTVLTMNADVDPSAVDMSVAFLPQPEEIKAMSILVPSQVTAMQYVVSQARPLSEKAIPRLVQRVHALGFDKPEERVRQCLRYIRDVAPLIVHFNCDRVLQFFVKDTHYRNQFETHMSGGWYAEGHGQRIEWEDRIFHRSYPKDCIGFDRPKYGVLNVLNDPAGVGSCSGYGDSFLVLRGCRLRTSFASCDTSNSNVQISSCEWYAHVLMEYSDNELRNTLEVAADPAKPGNSSCIRYLPKQLQGEAILLFFFCLISVWWEGANVIWFSWVRF